ncbi:thioesterase II family protein [Streptomyces sp. NPDC048603]|uniref:thioesterase II family protein n=1 Tax=Streptomyces sp. NPDC048603 TaxID=3365577 RepID=UPI003714BDA1
MPPADAAGPPPQHAARTVRGRPPDSSALLFPRPVPVPSLRLFLLHHAGGSHMLYHGWERYFPADWEVCPVDAPGRGRLAGLAPLDDSGALADFLVEQIRPWTDRPFALFGHSMGGLLAYEVTRRLAADGGPAPLWLGVSACGAPGTCGGRPPRHRLTDGELRDWLRAAGATPAVVLDDDSLWRTFGPLFRHDFAVVDTWRARTDEPPLGVPVSVYGGRADALVGRGRLTAWATRTEHYLGLNLHDGDHFYLTARPREVARQTLAAVAAARRLVPSPARPVPPIRMNT